MTRASFRYQRTDKFRERFLWILSLPYEFGDCEPPPSPGDGTPNPGGAPATPYRPWPMYGYRRNLSGSSTPPPRGDGTSPPRVYPTPCHPWHCPCRNWTLKILKKDILVDRQQKGVSKRRWSYLLIQIEKYLGWKMSWSFWAILVLQDRQKL